MMTTQCMSMCGSNSLIAHLSVKTYDMWEVNVTIERKIQI